MSLHTLANHLQSAGRGNDTVLVHMTPGEVGGLQSLAKAHGGSLTINPQTGLPEAGFLSSLLPMIAGAALSFIPGVGPLMAAGIVGGGATLATGSLSKGLMAGLGAYGGAGLASGLATTGATAATGGGFTGGGYGSIGTAGQTAAGAVTPTMSNIASGVSQLTNPGAFSALGAAMPAYSGAAGAASLMMQPMGAPPKGMKNPSLIRPYEYTKEINPEAGPERGNVWDGPVSSKERDYFTEKMTPLQPYWAPGPEYDKKKKSSSQTYTPMIGMYNPSNPTGQQINPYTGMPLNIMGMADGGMATGGISDGHLGDYSDGGQLLRGPGNGTSDSIPATIGDKQPARLAEGEFVIPARIVSELGNGSTDAGAKQLYAMMERVQRARKKTVGKNKVAFDAKARSELPA